MHQEKVPNFVKIPMGNTGEIIQIEYKKNKTPFSLHIWCQDAEVILLKKTPPIFASVIAAKTLILIELPYYIKSGREELMNIMFKASERM